MSNLMKKQQIKKMLTMKKIKKVINNLIIRDRTSRIKKKKIISIDKKKI